MAYPRAIVDGATKIDLAVRAGIHTGECEFVGEKVAGIAVVTGARISTLAAPGEVLVSSTVKIWSRARDSRSTIAVSMS